MMPQRRMIRIMPATTLPLLILLAFAAIRLAAGNETAGRALNARSGAPIPSEPPLADRITFGPLNDLGEATVTGAPGAVLPSAHVLLVNLDSGHQDHVISAADASFSAQIFAPPGSSIMVKHGPDHTFWNNIDPWLDIDQGAVEIGRTVFPSTTIYRPHEHSAGPDALPFAAAGSIGINVDNKPTTIDAAWSITGTVSPVGDLHPGGTAQVEARIRLYSQAIISTTDVSTITLLVDESRPWLMLYNENGNPLPYNNEAGSNRLTPGGFPILDGRRAEVRNHLEWDPVDWQYKSGHIIEGELTMDLFLDANMPPGIYRPILGFQFTGVPAGSGWRAALLSFLAGMPSFKFDTNGAALPPLEVKAPGVMANRNTRANPDRRLMWYLQMDKASLGLRGTGARQDAGLFQPTAFVVTQGAPYVLPPVDPFSGEPAAYRLEPYLPMISYGRGTTPGPPLLPFQLPGGQLCVTIQEPDGQQNNLGCDVFAQSVSGDRSTALGQLLNFGTIEISEYYGLRTAGDQFAVTFTKPGPHVIEMNGWIEDVWGNRYEGGGTYDIWVANPFDIDPGLMPGTPLAVGDAVNPTVQLQPRLPAYVNLTIHHFPFSNPELGQFHTVEGWANRFGYFAPDNPPITLDAPGEYRLDLFAEYLDPNSGEMYAAAATWGGVVMTPPDQAQLVAHGLRGLDSIKEIPGLWYILDDLCNDPSQVVAGAAPHVYNPYLNGDIVWSRLDTDVIEHSECLGDALTLVSSVQDTVGVVEAAITERYNPDLHHLTPPGTFEDRAQAAELPLFSSTTSGLPVSLVPEESDQIAYAYLSSQRPGVRVREAVAEDGHGSGYWRFDSMYDGQPGVGIEGDLPNDFKYQFVGAVYRDLESGLSEYLGQGSGWVHLPYSETIGSRVMPPFAGPGNGGWPTEGGPIMTLKGKDIHMFIQPTGVRPGAVLQLGDRFDFGGHFMPTLDSRVEVEVMAPSGQVHIVAGRANQVGYFYAPWDSFVVDEPGRWTANVRVWHDGRIGSGQQVDCDPANPFDPLRPCPSGDVLGSIDGHFSFYVVPPESPRLALATPAPGRLIFGQEVSPINISGPVPPGITNAAIDYTISMPGFILEEGQAQIANGSFSLSFDPKSLHDDFPNLDLTGRHGPGPGLADTFSFGLLLTGQQEGQKIYQATTLTIQGDRVYVENAEDVPIFSRLFLPLVVADN